MTNPSRMPLCRFLRTMHKLQQETQHIMHQKHNLRLFTTPAWKTAQQHMHTSHWTADDTDSQQTTLHTLPVTLEREIWRCWCRSAKDLRPSCKPTTQYIRQHSQEMLTLTARQCMSTCASCCKGYSHAADQPLPAQTACEA
jgi:hypothetical protein